MADNLAHHDSSESAGPANLAVPITSRFLFVDVAALRVMQLRRGARVRLAHTEGRPLPHKLERAAMDEVRQRLVPYSTPDVPSTTS